MLNPSFESAMRVYCNNPDNLNEDGSINWNFIDADMWSDGYITEENQVEAYGAFNDIADSIELR